MIAFVIFSCSMLFSTDPAQARNEWNNFGNVTFLSFQVEDSASQIHP
jgi:hypothetical protein